jgi:hypothetical protein
MEMRTSQAINANDVLCLIVNVSSDEEDVFVIWLIDKKIKEKLTGSTRFTLQNIELGSFLIAREQHQDSRKSDFIRDD